jgi:hypothetical protein
LSEVFGQVEAREGFLAGVSHDGSVILQIGRADESVSIDTLALVDPQADEVIRFLDSLDLCSQETLEHVGQVTHVELVMEVSRSFTELLGHLVVELESLLNDGSDLLADSSLELDVMLEHESTVDGVQRRGLGEVDSQKPEPSLKSRVNRERSSSGIHSGDILGSHDLSHHELLLVVPMGIVQMLTDQGDGGLGFIRIHLGHVKVINEVDELGLSFRAPTGTGLLEL